MTAPGGSGRRRPGVPGERGPRCGQRDRDPAAGAEPLPVPREDTIRRFLFPSAGSSARSGPRGRGRAGGGGGDGTPGDPRGRRRLLKMAEPKHRPGGGAGRTGALRAAGPDPPPGAPGSRCGPRGSGPGSRTDPAPGPGRAAGGGAGGPEPRDRRTALPAGHGWARPRSAANGGSGGTGGRCGTARGPAGAAGRVGPGRAAPCSRHRGPCSGSGPGRRHGQGRGSVRFARLSRGRLGSARVRRFKAGKGPARSGGGWRGRDGLS